MTIIDIQQAIADHIVELIVIIIVIGLPQLLLLLVILIKHDQLIEVLQVLAELVTSTRNPPIN